MSGVAVKRTGGPHPVRTPAGVLTPWGEVLCRPCLLQRMEGQPLPEMLRQPVEVRAGSGTEYGLTTCDTCGARVGVKTVVALEHELVCALRQRHYQVRLRRLPDGTSAVIVALPYASYLQIHGDIGGGFYISEHDAWGIWVPHRDRDAQDMQEALAIVDQIYNHRVARLAGGADEVVDGNKL